MSRILAFAGSAREESYNKKLVRVAARAAGQAGASVTLIDLRDYPMPLFDQDLEASDGVPETARKFKNLLVQHDGILLASPEYNSSISPLLKNALDWASRTHMENEPPLAAYRGKYAAILSASPGRLGGIRGLAVLRLLLGNLGMTVLPGQFALSGAGDAFDRDGNLTDERQEKSATDVARALVTLISKVQD